MTKKKERMQEPEPQEQKTLEELGVPAQTPRTYLYQPQEDITAYELALMIPVFVAIGNAEFINAADVLEQLPGGVLRHWVETSVELGGADDNGTGGG